MPVFRNRPVSELKKQLDREIGGRIRRCREALGYSREDFAEKADLAVSFLGKIELGTASFTAEPFVKICRALGVSADYILFGKEEQTDLSTINAMLSGLDPSDLPYVEEMIRSYIRAVTRPRD